MYEQEFEDTVIELMQQDFSAGTETFREKLLARCLDILRSNNADSQKQNTTQEIGELPDSDLELLAAAGSGCPFFPDEKDSDNLTLN